MKKTAMVAGVLILTLIGVYKFYEDSLPPRTPQKVARLISGLSIPYDSKVVEFKERWNDFNGNGYAYIVLSLTKEAFNRIYQEGEENEYKELPITENIYGPLSEISEVKNSGIYRVKIDDEATMSFKGTVLSKSSNKVFVYFLSI